MRIQITHVTSYAYASAPSYFIQSLRMTPTPHDGQAIKTWGIDLDRDARLLESRDGFGNIVHTVSITDPGTEIAITASGTVDCTDTAGVMSGTPEKFPPGLYLRETPLTQPGPDIEAFAHEYSKGSDTLERLHALNTAVHDHMAFDTSDTHVMASAAEAFHQSSGVCQDYSHILLAALRNLGVPARYVSGYFLRIDDVIHQDASHAWVEAYTGPDLGWVGFDPTNGISACAQHVRVACGLDYQDSAPARGTRHGGDGETLSVSVTVQKAHRGGAR